MKMIQRFPNNKVSTQVMLEQFLTEDDQFWVILQTKAPNTQSPYNMRVHGTLILFMKYNPEARMHEVRIPQGVWMQNDAELARAIFAFPLPYPIIPRIEQIPGRAPAPDPNIAERAADLLAGIPAPRNGQGSIPLHENPNTPTWNHPVRHVPERAGEVDQDGNIHDGIDPLSRPPRQGLRDVQLPPSHPGPHDVQIPRVEQGPPAPEPEPEPPEVPELEIDDELAKELALAD